MQEYRCASRISNPAASSVMGATHNSKSVRIGGLKDDRRGDEVVNGEYWAVPTLSIDVKARDQG